MDPNNWYLDIKGFITEEFIRNILVTDYELQVSETLRLNKGIIKNIAGLGISETPDIIKRNVITNLESGLEAYVMLIWSNFGSIKLYIQEIFKDENITSTKFYRSETDCTAIYREDRIENIVFDNVIMIVCYMKLGKYLLKGG